jgi:Flp pilus assembly protein protease CpaA
MDQYLLLAFRVGLTLWLIVVSVWDHRQRRVPNALLAPVMFGALGWQAYLAWRGAPSEYARGAPEGLLTALLAWVVLFLMWRAHVLGGADSKLLMALFALFPTMPFLILFSLVKLAVSLPLLAYQTLRGGVRQALRGVWWRLRSGQLLPSAADLSVGGQPNCWTYALPGVIYLWWLF